MMEEGGERLDQPCLFDLELELLRWVKKALALRVPPIMQKPGGLVTQHYGLDSKSRWREAVCLMMILAEPGISADGISCLGRQMALLFRQDDQLWEVKASQLTAWVERGLLNVKLLDRTLAYFQNQSSFLQYIKALKQPVPCIESPGFPGTQWNEFYWKDQTAMLLMQENDFPDGKNPEFCAQLFAEEPGKWRLKMDQFRRWLDRGKTDPLPEYYGNGKNCTECGVFLWDTKSYVKHMKRNHGFKVKDGKLVGIGQDVLKRERQEEHRELERRAGGEASGVKVGKRPVEASPEQDPFDAMMQSSSRTPTVLAPQGDVDKYLLSDDSDLDDDTEDSASEIKDVGLRKDIKPTKGALPAKEIKMKENRNVEGPKETTKTFDIKSSANELIAKNVTTSKEASIPKEPRVTDETKTDDILVDQPSKRVSTARSRRPDEDTIVSCPECGHQCAHSKIINHLKKCTRKQGQGKRKAAKPKVKETEESEKSQDEPPREKVNSSAKPTPKPDEPVVDVPVEDVKKPKESPKTAAIMKKIFMQKFSMQQEDSGQSEEDDAKKVPEGITSPPPIKLKLHRKDLLRESFEVSGESGKIRDSFDKLEPLIKQIPSKEVYEFDSNITMEESRPKYRKVAAKVSYQEDWDSTDFSLSSFRDASDREDKAREEKIREERAKEATIKAEIEKLKAVKLQDIKRREEKLKERLKVDKLKDIMLKEEKLKQEREKEKARTEEHKKEEDNRRKEVDEKRKEDEQRRETEEQIIKEKELRRKEEQKIKEKELRRKEEQKIKEKELRRKEELKIKEDELRRKEEQKLKDKELKRKEEMKIKEEEQRKEEQEQKEIERQMKLKEDENKKIAKEFQEKQNEERRREDEKQREDDKSRDEEEKSGDEFSLLALTKPHKRFQYSDYRSGKYQEEEKKRDDEKKLKIEEDKRHTEEDKSRAVEEVMAKRPEDSFTKLEPLIHPNRTREARTGPVLTKAAMKDIPSMIAESFAQEIFQDAKPTLRRGKMIPCPLCGVEYALTGNLEKHIDRDHREEGRDEEIKSRRKRRGTGGGGLPKKRKRDEPLEDLKKVDQPEDKSELQEPPPADILEKVSGDVKQPDEDEDKLTEYEIFQKLQLKEQKADRKRVECSECGLHIPTNTIKRHQQKHEKVAQKAKLLAENPGLGVAVAPKMVSPKKKKVACPECDKELPPNTLKRHVAKHKKGRELAKAAKAAGIPVEQGLADERIPCVQCGKMLPKNAMKRHLMKHETAGQDETDGAGAGKAEKAKTVRKKVGCPECGLLCAANVMRRHRETHRKAEAESPGGQHDAYAPIEITPTKEYWEMNEKKKPLVKPESKKGAKAGGKGAGTTGKGKEAKEFERSRNSEEEGEGDGPLEVAVRKVVSYRMTPKQALAEYQLTPKVLFDHLLGETDGDRLAILDKVSLSRAGEEEVIQYCRDHEQQLSYRAVIATVRELKVADGNPEFSLSKLEAYRWWYAFRKKFDLKITAKKK